MESKSLLKNVPFLKFQKIVYFKVDIYRLTCIVLLIFQISFAQNKERVDSLLNSLNSQHDTLKIETYRQLNMEYVYVDTKISKPYLDKAIELALKYDVKDQIAQTTNDLSVYYALVSDFEKSLATIDKAIQLHIELKDSVSLGEALNNKGIILDDLGQFDKAIAYHIKSLKLKELLNVEPENIAYSYYNIGYSYNSISNYEMSNSYLEKAKDIFSKLENYKEELNATNFLIANNLKASKQYSEAISMLNDIITYYKSNNYYNDLAGAYDSLGQIYIDTDSIEKAKPLFEKALAIGRNYEQKTLVAKSLQALGKVEILNKNYKNALHNYKQALEINAMAKAKDNMRSDYLHIAQAYAFLGDYSNAYKNHLNFFQLHDELLSKENFDKINELEIQYQTEKKEKELALKKAEIGVLKQKEEVSRNRQRLLAIGSLSILLFGGAIFYALKQKIKRNKVEREKLDNSLQFKEKELTTHALHLAHKNEVLLDLKSQLKGLKSSSDNSRNYQKVINTINLDINNDNNWEQFRTYFEEVHKDFNSKVMKTYPEVSTNDLRLMSLLKMNLSSKEIANILNISTEGVKKARYRLRKKLNLSTEDSLQEIVIEL